jgi:hypothetical protein
MSIYHNTQPDHEPIEYTHFECWFDEEGDWELFEEADDKALARKMDEIVGSWESSLDVSLPRPNVSALGLEGAFDLVLVALLEQGYDVFKGSDFIEIYPGE